jgi:hypothetical protein
MSANAVATAEITGPLCYCCQAVVGVLFGVGGLGRRARGSHRAFLAAEYGRRLAAPPGRSSSLRCGRSTWTCGFADGKVAAIEECPALPGILAAAVVWWRGLGVACPATSHITPLNPHHTPSNRVIRRHLHPPATAGRRGQHAAPAAVSTISRNRTISALLLRQRQAFRCWWAWRARCWVSPGGRPRVSDRVTPRVASSCLGFS